MYASEPTLVSNQFSISDCDNTAVNRDIVIVVDLNTLKKNNQTEKIASLQQTRQNLLHGLSFPYVNVFLKAFVADTVQDISTTWVSTSEQLNADFDNLFKITTFTETISLNFAAILKDGMEKFRTGRPYVPAALFVVTDKPISDNEVQAKPKDRGIYVGVTGVRSNYINQYSSYSDVQIAYDTWTDLSNDDPFRTLVCSCK